MAPLMGARSWQWFTPTYGDYVRAGRGQQRAYERREFARSLLPQGLLPDPFDDPTDCQHGCNGQCVFSGSERCTFICHDDLDARTMAIFDRHDRRVMEMLGEDMAAWAAG